MESRSLETTGADIPDAIRKGLATLGANRDDVEVEVVEEPSRGVFGLGAREARVRLTVKPAPETPASPAIIAPAEAPAPAAPAAEVAAPAATPPAADACPEANAARATLLDLLGRMGVRDVEVDVSWSEPDPDDEEVSLVLTVRAPDDDLVGQRGETLEALQHITRLLVGHEQEKFTRLLVDVNGHKARRRATLSQLAKRLAQQAIDTRRRVALEPMPPDERRVVHLALRQNPDVRTESIGEGDRRKVTIIPNNEW